MVNNIIKVQTLKNKCAESSKFRVLNQIKNKSQKEEKIKKNGKEELEAKISRL